MQITVWKVDLNHTSAEGKGPQPSVFSPPRFYFGFFFRFVCFFACQNFRKVGTPPDENSWIRTWTSAEGKGPQPSVFLSSPFFFFFCLSKFSESWDPSWRKFRDPRLCSYIVRFLSLNKYFVEKLNFIEAMDKGS